MNTEEGRKPLPLGGQFQYITKKGKMQELMKNFWFVTLCALLIAASVLGMSLPLRVAIGANAVLILVFIVRSLVAWRREANAND